MSHRSIVVLAVAFAAALISAAPASAANYVCEASALRGQVLVAPPIEPITANKGQAACREDRSGLASAVPAPLSVSAVFAETALAGPPDDVRAQTATASGGVADLRLGPAVDLGAQLPVDQALASVPPVTVPGVGTLDLRQAILAALQPSPEVLRIQIAAAYARARCVSGAVALEGSSSLTGIKFLGLDLPTDRAVTQVAQAIGGGTIDPSALDLAQLLPPGVTLDPVTETLVRTALDSLPNIPIPATLAEISITPGGQEKTATRLTQRALHVNLKLAGQQIIDLTLGEATVGADGVDCAGATAPPTSAAEAALACTNRRLVLSDVVQRRGRVRLQGYADRRYIGRTVDIHFVSAFGGGPRVARTRIKSDGSFLTTARLPRRSIRNTNRARYQARLGRERSLRLKLTRRMRWSSVRTSRGQVRLAGRVSRPLARPIRSIEVRRRVSCKRWEVVKRIKPRRSGSFLTRVQAPPTGLAGTYRLATRVRKTTRNPKTYPTFTLPSFVDPT